MQKREEKEILEQKKSGLPQVSREDFNYHNNNNQSSYVS